MRLALSLLLLLILLAPDAAAADPFPSTAHASKTLRQTGPVARRVAAADWLGAHTGDSDRAQAVLALQHVLADPEPAVRRAALNALVALQARSARAQILARLPHERHGDVLPATLVAAGRLGAPADVAAIRPFLARDGATRAAAIQALGYLGGPEARRLLLAVYQEPGSSREVWALRSTAMLALARCGHASDLTIVVEVYNRASGTKHWLARSALAHTVASLSPEPLDLLRQMIRDPDARVAVTAAAGMARSGHGQALVALLADAEASVRAAAVAGVAQGQVESAYPRLRRLARRDPARTVRWAASVALFRVADPAGDELVLTGVVAREPAVWSQAVALLARRTGAAHGRDADAWREELRRWRARGGRASR